MKDEFMRQALKLAKESIDKDEVPVGCVIVYKNEIIGFGRNSREYDKKVTSHAEINALNMVNKKFNTWKLDNCEMYITLEPCLMCYGAIIQSRIKNVYIALRGNKEKEYYFSKYISIPTNFQYGLLQDESKDLLQNFFKTIRLGDK